MYYSLTLVVTTSVTVTEVLVLELHFRSNYGLPLPPWLVRMASWMAAITFTKLDFAPTQTTVRLCVLSIWSKTTFYFYDFRGTNSAQQISGLRRRDQRLADISGYYIYLKLSIVEETPAEGVYIEDGGI